MFGVSKNKEKEKAKQKADAFIGTIRTVALCAPVELLDHPTLKRALAHQGAKFTPNYDFYISIAIVFCALKNFERVTSGHEFESFHERLYERLPSWHAQALLALKNLSEYLEPRLATATDGQQVQYLIGHWIVENSIRAKPTEADDGLCIALGAFAVMATIGKGSWKSL